jgi:calcium-dependent protein kinase
MPENIAREVLL